MIIIFKNFLIVFLFIVHIFGNTSNKSESYEYFMKAEYELLNNDYKMAEKYYKKALSLSPESTAILHSLVDLTIYQGKYSQAIYYLERILILDPYNKEIGLKLYDIYFQEGNNEKAILLLNSLLTVYPDDLDILYARANVQFSNQDWTELLKTYSDIYEVDTKQNKILIKIYEIGVATGNVELLWEILMELKYKYQDQIIHELLIEIANSNGKYLTAISLFTEKLAYTDITDEELIKLSQLYLRVEQFNDVINNLLPIYKAGNHSLDVLTILLIAFSSLNQTNNEIMISETLIKEYPELPVGFEALSFAYINAEENDKAIEVLLKALINFPNEVSFPFSLATIFNHSREFVKAEDYYHIALTIQPDLITAKHALAIMYEDMNDTKRSDSLFLHMINENENDAGGKNDYAYILSERKESSRDDFNYALQLAESAIAIDPKNAAFLDTIGWIYYKLGTYQKAEEFLQKSLSINDNNPVILEHLGDIYIKLNKTTEAINIYEKILELDSDNQMVRNKINNIYE